MDGRLVFSTERVWRSSFIRPRVASSSEEQSTAGDLCLLTSGFLQEAFELACEGSKQKHLLQLLCDMGRDKTSRRARSDSGVTLLTDLQAHTACRDPYIGY